MRICTRICTSTYDKKGLAVEMSSTRWQIDGRLAYPAKLAMGTKLGSLGVDLSVSLSRAEQQAQATESEYIGSAYWNEQKATGIRIVEELKTKVKTKGNGATLGQVRAQKTNTGAGNNGVSTKVINLKNNDEFDQLNAQDTCSVLSFSLSSLTRQSKVPSLPPTPIRYSQHPSSKKNKEKTIKQKRDKASTNKKRNTHQKSQAKQTKIQRCPTPVQRGP